MTGDAKGVMLRAISDDEVEMAVSVWLESGLPIKPRGRDTIENLRRLREADPELFIGAFEEGRMIGVILGTDDHRKGYVNRLAVLPDRRGSGIAKMLVERCESVFRARGRPVICTMIEEYNDESKALFTGVGYKREDEIVYYTKREADDV
ncbi:MAG TPA: GNAT family N-acetyltransferase [Thermoplasmata archaeon]|nr:GNAT family N-acetyltransferase [Thermoplasmata archaeon]